jgi:uncharacterized protein YndB with AHSA1/START domain
MPKVAIEKEINAPPKKVWKFISDIEKAPEWVVVMQSLEDTTDNPVKRGTVYREQSKIGPKESVTEWEVVRYDSLGIQVHKCEESDFKATLTMRVADNMDDTSTLHHTTEYQLMPNFRPLGWLLETLFIKRSMRKNLNKSVNNCKRMIEEDLN